MDWVKVFLELATKTLSAPQTAERTIKFQRDYSKASKAVYHTVLQQYAVQQNYFFVQKDDYEEKPKAKKDTGAFKSFEEDEDRSYNGEEKETEAG